MQRFKGTVYAQEPETIVIDYYQPMHVNAEGKICHGPGAEHGVVQPKHLLPPHLSPECREYCAKLFREDPDVDLSAVLASKDITHASRCVQAAMRRRPPSNRPTL